MSRVVSGSGRLRGGNIRWPGMEIQRRVSCVRNVPRGSHALAVLDQGCCAIVIVGGNTQDIRWLWVHKIYFCLTWRALAGLDYTPTA